MKTIQLVDPAMKPGDVKIVPSLGLSVEFGHQIEVPDDVAGRAPSDDDPGEGLLAQTDLWAESNRED